MARFKFAQDLQRMNGFDAALEGDRLAGHEGVHALEQHGIVFDTLKHIEQGSSRARPSPP